MRVFGLRGLLLRARALLAPRRAERDLDEELAFHIEREARQHMAAGVARDEAYARARARFGSITVAADECRDARGMRLLDNLVRDVLYAWRSFRRTPVTAVTIVATVALGLGLVTVVFSLLNAAVFRVDEVRNPDELFAVERQQTARTAPEPFTRETYDALVRESDVFSELFAMGPDIDRWIDGRRLEGSLVTGTFFQTLGASAARGRILTPSDDEPGGGQVIVLSHRAWVRHFASDPGVLTRTVQVNDVPFQVVGVMPEGFRGLTVVPPDFWAPLSLVGAFGDALAGREGADELGIVGRIRPGLTRGQALAALQLWDSRRAAERGAERPPASLVLEPRQGTVPLTGGVMGVFAPLFFAFGLILMIACANVANLLLARAVARQREIGIRLAMGASRRRVIGQLLIESLLLALVSAALAFAISRLVLRTAIYALTSTWAPAIGDIRLVMPPADWRVALFLVTGAILSTLFFALAPALQATRLELLRAIRGEVMGDARPSRARNGLVALQVTGSVLLLICAAVFLRGAWAAANVDPGIRTADIVTVQLLNEQRRGAMLEAVKNEPTVAAVAAALPGGLGGRPAFAKAAAPEVPAAPVAASRLGVSYQFVSPEYFGVLGIDLVRGRGFSPSEHSPTVAVAVLSESVARHVWPGGDAIGQVLWLEPEANADGQAADALLPQPRTVVVGIVRDVPGFRLAGMRMPGAGVYMPIDPAAAGTSLTLRVRGDSERARHALAERLTAIDPNMAQVATMRAIAGMEAYLLGIPFWVTLVLGGIALVLTVSGLYSVLSYLVEQRTREIGVRMTLGATRGSIGVLVLSQSARPVGLGLVLGAGLTAALGAALLATPAAADIGAVVRLFDPVAYGASLFCIVAACACAALVPALQAGRVDPVAALRQD